MSSDWTRRDFIRNAAALSAALAGSQIVLGQNTPPATSQASAPPPPPPPKPAPATKRFPKNAALRVGMIACGGKGAHNLGALAECGVTIAALCDIDDRPLARASRKFPDARTFNDYRQMLEAMGKEIDAVCISTPDHCHAPAATLAMSMGKHVYCEKPLSHNISEARMMAKMAREKKLMTQMGNQGHSSQGSADQVAWVKSGVIGPVHEVHVWTDRPIWPQGCRLPKDNPPCPPEVKWDLWLGPAPVRPYNPCYHPFSWRGWWDFGTGGARRHGVPYHGHGVLVARPQKPNGGRSLLRWEDGSVASQLVDHPL